ncbi:ABC transporter permease [Deinococcus radiopugnans]|uniref:Lantibiotic ABC transporter permease n=1 Tax=Deinococcus radiopugnans ATCC 19172 TaxID=585398 RepID=A0A5C4Y9T8_9DEIO|nr:ABC transporter permease [Deinococcus radiopugnans]MBB6015973.1 hypothetical protein [Deinococcus radiopugnans ATCC 19172]TNM72338.1 lantibiotic ABC transporter permease [Deinococcus radiopugnans ATCC 19172]
MLWAELQKLRRSSLWLIAFFLPVLAVATGSINYAANRHTLTAGWSSATSQMMLFYGLLFFSVGVALIVATSWRSEHKGTNFYLLQTTSRSALHLFLAKLVAAWFPVVFMQLVFAVGGCLAGWLFLGLTGWPPTGYFTTLLLAGVAALPLIALQSLLSMWSKSFTTPVVLCLVLSLFSWIGLQGGALATLTSIVPQALITRTFSFGSSIVAESVRPSLSQLTTQGGLNLLLTAAFIWCSVWVMRVVKTR